MTLHRRLWPARTIFLWVILLTLPMTLPAVVSAAPRPSFAHEQRLNAGWKFLRVDGGGAARPGSAPCGRRALGNGRPAAHAAPRKI